MPSQMNLRYEVLGPLFSGQGSRALLGLTSSGASDARPIVLIRVPPDIAKDPEQVAKLRKETARAMTLEHPHILRVEALARVDGGLARVVEFADGESLRRVLEVCGRLPTRFTARVAVDAATGLHYAHMAGNDDGTPLVHGDVRPETLMVCFNGKTKISGYGALSVAPREEGGKRVVHRRLYAAPEQIIGGRSATTVTTDVYLLGLVLYECLTGRIPFGDEPSFDQAVVQKPLPLEDPTLPASLIPVLQRATAKRANERYASALAFRDAVEEAVGNLPSHEELAAYLSESIPSEDMARAARRRSLETGLAEHSRKFGEGILQGSSRADPDPTPISAISVPSVITDPPSLPPVSLPDFQPRPPSSILPAVMVTGGMIGALALISAFYVYADDLFGHPSAPEPPAKVATAPVKAVTPPVPPPHSVAALGIVPASGGPAPVVKPAAFTPGAALELTVTPAVDVLVDGKASGHTPVSLQLPAGRHVLELKSKSLGISARRTLEVREAGKQVERIYLTKGFLTVNVPPNAVIFLDGRPIAKKSIQDYSAYEGSHHLVVMLGKAKWQQALELHPNEHQKYDVSSGPQSPAVPIP